MILVRPHRPLRNLDVPRMPALGPINFFSDTVKLHRDDQARRAETPIHARGKNFTFELGVDLAIGSGSLGGIGLDLEPGEVGQSGEEGVGEGGDSGIVAVETGPLVERSNAGGVAVGVDACRNP